MSFEGLLVVFMISGRYKAAKIFKNFPMDITVFLGILVLIGAIFRIYTVYFKSNNSIKKPALFGLLLFALFSSYALLSCVWSPNLTNALFRLLNLIGRIGLPVFCVLMLIVRDKDNIERFINNIFFASIVFVFAVLYFEIMYPPELGYTLNFWGGNYQGIGSIVSLGATIAIFKFSQTEKWKSVLFVAFVMVYFYALIHVGNRTALLSALFSMLPLLLLLRIKNKRLFFMRKFFKASLLAGLISIILFFYSLLHVLPVTLSRMHILLSQYGGGMSVYDRLMFLKISLFQIIPRFVFFGCGLGGWQNYSGFGTAFHYPHNIIIEIISELGLFGLMIFFIFMFAGLNYWRKSKQYNYNFYLIISMLFINVFFNALTSGTFSTDYWFFVVVALMFMKKTNQRYFYTRSLVKASN